MVDGSRVGPWAVIAGGSEGVGAAFARQLAGGGVSSVLIARKEAPLAETARAVRAAGVDARTLACDLLAPDALHRIRAATDDLDVGLLIVNAGANTYRSEFVEADLAGVERVIDLNVRVPLALCRHFGARLKRRGRGGIIVLGSGSGYVGHERISVYAAAKAFSRVFTEGLWLELRPHGVDVLHLVLGLTRTPAMERAGLRFDVPGLAAADPEDMAREGLEHLADGPVWVAGDNFDAVRRDNAFPRDEVVLANVDRLRRLLGG
jgi:short-subunit dehydrogenase